MIKKRSSTGRKMKKSSKPTERQLELKKEIFGIFYIGLAALLLLSLTLEETGSFGYAVRVILHNVTGEKGSLLLPILFAVQGWQLIKKHRNFTLTYRFFGLVLGCLLGIIVLHLIYVGIPEEPLPLGYTYGGGFIGSVILYSLNRVFSYLGTIVVLNLFFMISLILVLDRPLVQIFEEIKNFFRNLTVNLGKKKPGFGSDLHYEQASATREARRMLSSAEAEPSRGKFPRKRGRELEKTTTKKETPAIVAGKSGIKLGLYQLPPLDFLQSPRQKRNLKLLDQSVQLEETLASFGVNAQVIEVHQGPVITRYDIQPAPGVKVSRIVNLANDLALALAARGLRIEAPIPGKAAIGIEVPNKETRTVTIREVLESRQFWEAGKLGMALGVDIAGEPVVADLNKMPHLLIAGATGSGKSVCLNTLILSLLYRASPAEVKMIMIDPKMVELSVYDGVPHLSAPVVTDPKKAAAVLRAVVTEMETRYKVFAAKGVRDLARYNQVLDQDELPMPYVIVFIDELADLMMVAPVEVEDSICRLAQMARATGIHLVVATQRPSVDVITGLIKANIPSRIAFAVSSQVDSRTILDTSGAEQLLGRGDMLFSPAGSLKPLRLQGALVLDQEIKAVTDHWKKQGTPDYVEAFINAQEKEVNSGDPAEEDELFWDAVKMLIDSGQASASSLQRRFRIGYNRAARLIDMMEARGIVGPHNGSKPREILITSRQLEEMHKQGN